MNQAVIFIDGNNFYHNLRQMKIKPGNIDFTKLVNTICKKLGCQLKEARYYNSTPTLGDGKELYYSHLKFIDGLKNKPKFTVKTRKLQVHSSQELIKEKRELIDSMDLCNSCKPIVEENILGAIGNVKKKEKGIDVMLAIDLVEHAIKKKADYLIILSGDADFVPAMDLAKENNGTVFSVGLAKGYSRELREKFEFYVLGKNNLMENCFKD
jgi:uncharacterized LabA/DUF88 family protein